MKLKRRDQTDLKRLAKDLSQVSAENLKTPILTEL